MVSSAYGIGTGIPAQVAELRRGSAAAEAEHIERQIERLQNLERFAFHLLICLELFRRLPSGGNG